jgi:hypothetical protein
MCKNQTADVGNYFKHFEVYIFKYTGDSEINLEKKCAVALTQNNSA